MLDPYTAAWAAEFVLRQPVEDWIANEILFALPLPSPLPHRLRRTILLHRLSSDLSRGSPSLRTLHSLDLLLDYRFVSVSSSSSESMASAYRAVALHCVADALSASGDDGSFRAFADGLCSRVADLERAEPAVLAAEPLRELRIEIEAAAQSGAVRAAFLERNTAKEALDAVSVYLKAATEELGPSFVELAALAVVEQGEPGGELDESDEDSTVTGLSDDAVVDDDGINREDVSDISSAASDISSAWSGISEAELVSEVEGESLCSAYSDMYLGGDPFDKEAKGTFGRSLL